MYSFVCAVHNRHTESMFDPVSVCGVYMYACLSVLFLIVICNVTYLLCNYFMHSKKCILCMACGD